MTTQRPRTDAHADAKSSSQGDSEGASVTGIYTYFVGGTRYTNADIVAAQAMLTKDPDIQQSFQENLQHNEGYAKPQLLLVVRVNQGSLFES